jgi:guanylate kinase
VTARRGRLYVIAAPSGAGKTSLVRALLERRPDFMFSISCTTRTRRPSEIEGRDYFFVSVQEFERRIAAGEFLEYARVFDNYYGTLRSQVETLTAAGADVLLEIDWQGARQVRGAMKECHSIFILPPSAQELERRLRGRGTDSEAVIGRRLSDARGDMAHWAEFDYVVINDDFARALDDLTAIVSGQGAALKATRPEVERLVPSLVEAASG